MKWLLVFLFFPLSATTYEEGRGFVVRHTFIGEKKEEKVMDSPRPEEKSTEESDILLYLLVAEWDADD